jgi:HEAT repeat protein
MEALADKDVMVRRAAAEALGEIENHKAAAPLARAIDDGDPVVRRLAAQALGELDGFGRAPARLVSALGDRDAELRVIAAMSLGEIADPAALPELATAYRSEDPRLRFAVVKAVSQIEDRRGDATLVLARQDRDQIIRRTAAEALEDRREDDDD